MAEIRQSAPALLAVTTPDAGLETGSVISWGSPALLAVTGPPGSLETAGAAEANIHQSTPVLLAVVGGAGTLTWESPPVEPGTNIRQAAPILLAVASGGRGRIETAGPPIVLNRLGGRLLRTGVLGGVLV